MRMNLFLEIVSVPFAIPRCNADPGLLAQFHGE
jgi:hypothetical protein